MNKFTWFNFSKLQKKIIFIDFIIIIYFIYYFMNQDFFSFANETIGHDYSFDLSRLIAGYYFWIQNNFYDLPFFTPIMCGGVFLFINPQSIYFSLIQLFIFFISPLKIINYYI